MNPVECSIDYSAIITALATGLLVIVGLAQVFVLIAQKRQTNLELIGEYLRRWRDCQDFWGKVVFIGRDPDEYYQVADEKKLNALEIAIQQSQLTTPTIWARESIQIVCGILSEVCIRILHGQLHVADAYPIFGTELLRQSKPLRKLLDSEYKTSAPQQTNGNKHIIVRTELQDWLIYHDGIRRRCLILLDLLWAEAARLEDLPPSDMRSAADAKKKSGRPNRIRIFKETYRLNGFIRILMAWRLSHFLHHSEYRTLYCWTGISRRRLKYLEDTWTKRLLAIHV
jgi:hypothetical protein